MADRLSSLELIGEEAQGQLTEQFRHFESIDGKAGLVLGFAGVLVAVSSNRTGAWGALGLCLAVSAALLALFAFQPRNFPALDIAALRKNYLKADPEFTRLHLLDARLEMWDRAGDILSRKSLRLSLALVSLVAAAATLAGGILFE